MHLIIGLVAKNSVGIDDLHNNDVINTCTDYNITEITLDRSALAIVLYLQDVIL